MQCAGWFYCAVTLTTCSLLGNFVFLIFDIINRVSSNIQIWQLIHLFERFHQEYTNSSRYNASLYLTFSNNSMQYKHELVPFFTRHKSTSTRRNGNGKKWRKILEQFECLHFVKNWKSLLKNVRMGNYGAYIILYVDSKLPLRKKKIGAANSKTQTEISARALIITIKKKHSHYISNQIHKLWKISKLMHLQICTRSHISLTRVFIYVTWTFAGTQ